MLTKTGPLQPRGVLTSASDPPRRRHPRADPDPLPQGAQHCLLLQGGAFCHQSPWYLPAPLTTPPGLAFEALSKPLASQHLTPSPIGQAQLWQVLFTTHTHTHTHTHTERQFHLVLCEVPSAAHQACPLPPGSFACMPSPPAPHPSMAGLCPTTAHDTLCQDPHCPDQSSCSSCWVSGRLPSPSGRRLLTHTPLIFTTPPHTWSSAAMSRLPLLSPPWTTRLTLVFQSPSVYAPQGIPSCPEESRGPDLSPAVSSLPHLQLQGRPCSTCPSSSTQAWLLLSQVRLKAPPQTAFPDHPAQEPLLPRVTLPWVTDVSFGVPCLNNPTASFISSQVN